MAGIRNKSAPNLLYRGNQLKTTILYRVDILNIEQKALLYRCCEKLVRNSVHHILFFG